jgi:hypothetical protein
MILEFILYALAAYIIYKVVFEVVIPIFRTTQKIRQQFGDVQQHMRDQMNATQNQNKYNNPPDRPAPEQKKSSKAGDYIDFEEVK